jgi:hypothetical protein
MTRVVKLDGLDLQSKLQFTYSGAEGVDFA